MKKTPERKLYEIERGLRMGYLNESRQLVNEVSPALVAWAMKYLSPIIMQTLMDTLRSEKGEGIIDYIYNMVKKQFPSIANIMDRDTFQNIASTIIGKTMNQAPSQGTKPQSQPKQDDDVINEAVLRSLVAESLRNFLKENEMKEGLIGQAVGAIAGGPIGGMVGNAVQNVAQNVVGKATDTVNNAISGVVNGGGQGQQSSSGLLGEEDIDDVISETVNKVVRQALRERKQ